MVVKPHSYSPSFSLSPCLRRVTIARDIERWNSSPDFRRHLDTDVSAVYSPRMDLCGNRTLVFTIVRDHHRRLSLLAGR